MLDRIRGEIVQRIPKPVTDTVKRVRREVKDTKEYLKAKTLIRDAGNDLQNLGKPEVRAQVLLSRNRLLFTEYISKLTDSVRIRNLTEPTTQTKEIVNQLECLSTNDTSQVYFLGTEEIENPDEPMSKNTSVPENASAELLKVLSFLQRTKLERFSSEIKREVKRCDEFAEVIVVASDIEPDQTNTKKFNLFVKYPSNPSPL